MKLKQRVYHQKKLKMLMFILCAVLSIGAGTLALQKKNASALESRVTLSDKIYIQTQGDGSGLVMSGDSVLCHNATGVSIGMLNPEDAGSLLWRLSVDGGTPIETGVDNTYNGTTIAITGISLDNGTTWNDISYTVKTSTAPITMSYTSDTITQTSSNARLIQNRCIFDITNPDNVPVTLYYSSNELYTTVNQVKTNAQALSSENTSFILSDSTNPVQYYLYGIDAFGRLTSVNGPAYDSVDSTAPTFESVNYQNYVSQANGIYYYNETLSDKSVFSASVSDTNSGIFGVVCENGTVDTTVSDGTANVFLPAAKSETSYNATIYAQDNAGNTQTYTLATMVYDKTAPKIENVKSSYKGITNKPITVTFDVTEQNLRAVQAQIGENEFTAQHVEGNKYKVVLQGVEIYNQPLVITASDYAGHSTKYTSSNITLDTVPINLSMNYNGVDILNNNGYMTKDAIINCDLDSDDVKSITASLLDANGAELQVLQGQLDGTQYRIFVPDIGDGVYLVKVSTIDLAGNTSDFTSKTLTLDTVAPVVNFSVTGNKVHLDIQESNPSETEFVSLNITAQDNSHSFDTVKFLYNGKEYEKSLTFLQSLIATASNWSSSGDVYSLDLQLITEANYHCSISMTDKSGNTSKNIAKSFVYDITAPYFESASCSAVPKEYEDYQYISSDAVQVSFTITDAVSKVKNVIVGYKEDNQHKTMTCVPSGDCFAAVFGKTQGQKIVINSLTMTDACGNKDSYIIRSGIIVDKETKDVELLHVSIKDDAKSNIINKDVNLKMSMADTFSGIASYVFKLNNDTSGKDFTKRKHLTYNHSFSDVLKASENEGDNIAVSLTVKDNADNEKTVKKTYTIDTTAPKINLSYDQTVASGFYNTTRVAVISVEEKHFDPAGVNFVVTKDGKQFNKGLKFKTTDDVHYKALVPFDEDGDYTFTLSISDLAGNESHIIEDNTFTIDKTLPVMDITYDNNRASNGNYYNAPRIATITIKEHNFDSKQVDLHIIGEASVSSWSTNGDIHSAVVSFSTDGEFGLGGRVSDLAGNRSAEIKPETFIVDLTGPEIAFSNIAAGSSYNNSVTPSVSASDSNYDSASLSITGVRYGSHKELTYSANGITNGELFVYSDFVHKPEFDDHYTLTAKAVDKAGNETVREIQFSVNRFGSTYRFDTYTKDAIETYYFSPTKDFVVIEENVDELVSQGIYYTLNGNVTELKNGSDFSVSHDDGESGWHEYQYKIHTDSLKDDGIYTFTVYSKDKAGNEVDNKSRQTPFSICIDKTKPVLAISGVENGKIYEMEKLDVSVDVTDNILLKDLTVTLDGKETVYQGKELKNGMLHLEIPEQTSEHTLKLMACDMAGNQTEVKEYAFTVSSSKIVTTTKNAIKNPAFWICAGVVCVLIIGAAVFGLVSFKRKKKDNTVE